MRRARAPVIARMDADDVSHPDRLRRQWEVLRERPDVTLVATLYDGIDARGGGVDQISCGSGRDTVRADRGDHVASDSERVKRS